ncbi:MAG: DNA polymerase III subunit beta [Ruminococcaceae bacterium]|nr:DNA polymerase III subunit beta [Oscillospiraceae bacterium]
MNILCNKVELLEAVSNVQRAVSTKASLPALEGILLRAQGSTLYLAGFDMELGITTTIPAQVKEPGEIVLSARMFGDIVRKMPSESLSIYSDGKYNTIIRGDVTEFSIMGMSAADYPDIPSIEDGASVTLSQPVIKSMVRQTIFAVAAPNDPRPIYTGTRFELSNNHLRLVSMDGYRLAIRNEEVAMEEEMSFVVPGKTLQEILKLLKDEEKPCSLIVGRRHIIFEIDGYAVISRLLDGEFIAYEKIISAETDSTITVNTRTFIDAVDRVSLVVNDRLKSPLVCAFRNDTISVSCTTPLGSANDSISAVLEGDQVDMGFNSRFLLDALKNSETDEVKIELNGPAKPMKVLPKEGDAFLFLVLPVRLK